MLQIGGWKMDNQELEFEKIIEFIKNKKVRDFKNAIEELERVERTNKKLEIEFSQGEIFFQIELCNSIADKSKGKKQLFLTEKEDKRNHGLGIKNVKKVVKECGGEVFFEKRDEVFCVKVLLKNDRSRT